MKKSIIHSVLDNGVVYPIYWGYSDIADAVYLMEAVPLSDFASDWGKYPTASRELTYDFNDKIWYGKNPSCVDGRVPMRIERIIISLPYKDNIPLLRFFAEAHHDAFGKDIQEAVEWEGGLQ